MNQADHKKQGAALDDARADEPQDAVQQWACDRCSATNDLSTEFCARCGADGRAAKLLRSPSASRFPADQQKRRAILDAIASTQEKYSRPFEQGRVALVSLIGTESWSDYGAVVLQMAILDTLMSIESKLGEISQQLGEEQNGHSGR